MKFFEYKFLFVFVQENFGYSQIPFFQEIQFFNLLLYVVYFRKAFPVHTCGGVSFNNRAIVGATSY